jgi:hypothetical protein
MYNDPDDEFEQQRPKAAEFPRELRERLVDDSEAGMPAIRYDAIGPERWPAAVSYGAKLGFTTWRNPRATDVRIRLNLGPDAQLHTGFEMNLVPPQHRIPRGLASELLKTGQCLRREYGRLLICIPAGQTLALPAVFDPAIRSLREGVVVGGEAPFLVKVVDGADETNPPPLHSSLVPPGDGNDSAPVRSAAARRRS